MKLLVSQCPLQLHYIEIYEKWSTFLDFFFSPKLGFFACFSSFIIISPEGSAKLQWAGRGLAASSFVCYRDWVTRRIWVYSWHIWIDLGLKKGRGWFLKFLEAPYIIHGNSRISCGKCDYELAYKVSCLFLSIPANHRPSILFNDKLTAGVLLRELAHCLQILPVNEKLGLEADKISQTLLTNRMQRKLRDHQTTAEGRKWFAKTAWLAAGALQTWVGCK